MNKSTALLIPILLLFGCAHPKVAEVKPVTPTPPTEAVATLPAPPVVVKHRVLDVPVWTQTVAVIDAKISVMAPDNYKEDLTGPVTERLESAFLATGRFEIVERSRIEPLRKELMTTSDSMWFDQTSVAKLGKFLGAKYVILPSGRLEVGFFGTRLDLTIKVEDVETASIVQTFNVRTASASLSINSSITSCLDRIRLEVADAIAPVYPPQAMIVHSPVAGIYWAEAKQTRAFYPGQKVRILQSTDVWNPVKGTTAPFTVDSGRGRIQSVEAFGIVIKAPGVKAEDGWMVEVLP